MKFQVPHSCKANARKSVHSPRIISLSSLSLATDVTNATLGASGLWLGTRTGAGGTVTLTEGFFFGHCPKTVLRQYINQIETIPLKSIEHCILKNLTNIHEIYSMFS